MYSRNYDLNMDTQQFLTLMYLLIKTLYDLVYSYKQKSLVMGGVSLLTLPYIVYLIKCVCRYVQYITVYVMIHNSKRFCGLQGILTTWNYKLINWQDTCKRSCGSALRTVLCLLMHSVNKYKINPVFIIFIVSDSIQEETFVAQLIKRWELLKCCSFLVFF